MSPKTGFEFSISAILTTNSPFFLMNSFVPSSGSTHHKCFQDLRTEKGCFSASSPVMGIPVGSKCFLMIFEADKDRKSTRLNSSHVRISYAVFCLKKKKKALYI